MAKQPIKRVQPVQQTVQPATQPNVDAAQRPVFYRIPSTAGAVEPTVRESTATGDGTTSLVGLLNMPEGSANNQLPPTATDLNNNAVAPEEPDFGQVLKENLAPTMISMIERTVDEEVFEVDLEYTPEMRQEDADEFFREYGTGTPWEANQLGSARSPAHMEMLKGKVLDLRERNARAGQRPAPAILGGLFDIDILVGFGGAGIATKSGTLANLATRGIQGAAAGAGIYTYNEATADLDIRTPEARLWDVGTFALSRAFVATTPVTKPVTAGLDEAINAERQAVQGAQELPSEITYTPIQTGVKTESTPPNLGALKYEPVTEAAEPTTLYHGTNTQFDTVDPNKSGGIAFFAEDTAVASRYATGAGGNRARVTLEDSYLVNEGIAYELKGNKWVAAGEVARGFEDFVTPSTLKPLSKALPNIDTDDATELLQVSASLTPKSARIIEQEFQNLNLLDITTPEGRDVILGLKENSKFVRELQGAAQEDRVARDLANSSLNNRLWSATKVSTRYGDQIANDFVKQLESLGYDGIRFTDDAHKSVGLFPSGLRKGVPTTTGAGVKQQYQVPSTQSTTIMNPKGYGVLQQQYVFPKKLQEQLDTATAELAKDLTTGAIKTSNTSGYTRTELLKNNLVVNRATSTADELMYYIGDDPTHPAYHLLASVTTEGDNVATAQSAMMNIYGALLVNTELALRAAIKEITGSGRGFLSSVNGKYQENALRVFKDFQLGMQKLDSKIVAFEGKHARLPNDKELGTMLDTLKITQDARTDVALKKVMQTYMKSGFAERIYDDAKLLGTFGEDAEKILRRPSYMPVKHNYDAMKKLVDDGKATWEEVEAFVGSQIVRMYPKLLDPNYAKAGRSFADVLKGAETAITNPFKLSVRQVGQHFIATQRGNAHSLGDVTSVGMNKTTMHTMLTKAGLGADDADVVVAKVFEDQQEVGKSVYKHGRRRIAWDWEDFLDTKSGHRITMADIVDNSAMSNLDAYARGMAHRNGLARYNIKSEAELDNILESIYERAPKGVDTNELQKFLSDTKDDLLGNGAGSDVPKSIRAAQALADMFLLVGSGLLTLVDMTSQVVRTGVIKNFSNIHYGLRAALSPMSKFTKDEATDLADIMTGRLMQGSRWKWFPTYYSDNFQITGGIYEAAQYYGQSARFMNLSETAKRFQIGILANMYVSATKKAAAGSAKDIAFLSKKLNMSDELIKKVTAEWNKHGNKIDNWDGDVRIAYEQKIMHEADNLALSIQKGETPAIFTYSSVGKVIFPYMSYAFAVQQKVLRRTYNRDGSVGLAMLMAAQIPVAMMVAMAQNIRNGKEPDDDLVLGTVRAMSALGVLNYPIELTMAGLGQNSVTALAPFSKSYNLIGQFFNSSGRLQDGDYEVEFADEVDWHQVLKNSPLNSATPLHYLYLGFNPED